MTRSRSRSRHTYKDYKDRNFSGTVANFKPNAKKSVIAGNISSEEHNDGYVPFHKDGIVGRYCSNGMQVVFDTTTYPYAGVGDYAVNIRPDMTQVAYCRSCGRACGCRHTTRARSRS